MDFDCGLSISSKKTKKASRNIVIHSIHSVSNEGGCQAKKRKRHAFSLAFENTHSQTSMKRCEQANKNNHGGSQLGKKEASSSANDV
mmetsp:Transcript_7751/g.15125  ORF Transcript_7751/g.15125 Transcript_7751/m.15125 type:complete len:87 (+) Transcript_7751:746-1006(+)